MDLINSIAGFLSKLLQWWFTVMPWEQAILVRKGNVVRLLPAGLYFKIPFIDSIYIQTTRMRMQDLPAQTISTKDGSSITLKSAVGYAIGNVLVLYNTLSHPEMTLGSMVLGQIGEYVRGQKAADITPSGIEQYVLTNIKAENYGLKNITVKITTFALVKTFRLIQDHSGMYEGLKMDPNK